MSTQGRRANVVFLTALSFFITLLLLETRTSYGPIHSFSNGIANNEHQNVDISENAGNDTLGFEKILALSSGTQWRVDGLRAAAKETDLDIYIPPQPGPSEHLAKMFVEMGPLWVKKPTFGAAMAWVAHLDLLKYIIQQGLDSALILEDDADWDVQVKNQMRKLAFQVRNYTSTDGDISHPYGENWDVLWLGHCAERWDRRIAFLWPDPTSGGQQSRNLLYGIESFMGIPDGHRSIWQSVDPLCTFAYAVTRTGAQKVHDWAIKGEDEAFDIKLRSGCLRGGLRCISIMDQLFHHHKLAPQDELPAEEGTDAKGGSSSDIAAANREDNAQSKTLAENIMGSTPVIVHSARCKAQFNSTCREIDLRKGGTFM